jgi:hypothetical protein
MPAELLHRLRMEAEAAGLSVSEYARALLERAVQTQEAAVSDLEALFETRLIEWWAYRGQGDPGQIVGARVRAQAIGMTLAGKMRQVLKECLDHALL